MPRGRGGGGVRHDPTASAPLASPSYYERVGQLQQALRDSEQKRLDLEDKLYEYNKSDKCRAKLKCAKLKKYLKEVCESERRAHVRNQGYLKKFQCVQTYVEHLTTNTEKLQKLKTEYEAEMKKMHLLLKGSLGMKDEARVKVGINSRTAMSRGLYQPATIFMGRQMSAISSIDDFSTEQRSKQPTKNCSIPDPHSHQQTAQSSRVTDSCVVQTNSDTQCLNKSDKIDGKTSLQIVEKTPVTSHALSEEEQTHCWEIGSSTRHSKSNLSEGRKSAELHSSLQERLSPENRTTDLKCDSSSRSEGSGGEILTQEHTEVREERASLPVPTLSVSEHCASVGEKHSAWKGFSDDLAHGDPKSPKAFLKMQEEQEEESSCSSSDLTVSVSEEKLSLENLESLLSPGTKLDGEDGRQASWSVYTTLQRDPLITDCSLQTQTFPDSKRESFPDSPRQSEQMPDWHLLKTQGQCMKEHNNSPKEEATALLKKVLTEECDHRSAIHSNESSCSMPSILNDNNGIMEAKPALRLNSVLTREQEVSSGCGDESKEESIAAIPVTGHREADIVPSELFQFSLGATMKETKAYQLMKKSTLQDNLNQTEERFESQFSSLDIGSSIFKTKTAHKIASEASFSSSEGSPLSRHESKRDPVTTIKSNAFWGESDDSNSEIEAALRPRDHNMSDDFDDFYDT
ncbi:centrosomal protein kizuna isoform X1 [Cricetulus griseus]|uniref:Centrosomal protein kizuna n=1 Tax=Cricetulus griseus TaxID=10029 RepID=A0A8C2MQL4_CRIGR|nr:centrosomal protein kizuna isoform X3 [Cricetulus griseus]XP_035316971.1 centrosomal protein kizuna isoform X1 [Cricetulus griseus]